QTANEKWITGRVVRGAGRGAALGFPTANLHIKAPLPEGVFAAWVQIEDSTTRLPAVMHVGPRPVFDEDTPSVEIHIFDFDSDIYGQEVTFLVAQKLRDIKNFDTVNELIDAIHADCVNAKE